MKLAADGMLGGVAKWLRLLGFDTYYLRGGPKRPMPDRVLLTRRPGGFNRAMFKGWSRVINLTANETRAQLAEIVRTLDLTREDLALMTRCSVCNQELRPAGPDEVAGRVPEYVQATQTEFSECPGCGRIYWPGTHQRPMQAVIEELF